MNDATMQGARSRDLLIADIVARTGIDEAMIERLVRSFYGRARCDPLIGPVFEGTVHDWERHIGRLCEFWSSVVLMSGRYHGQPLIAHLPLPVDTPHFNRWLALFAATAEEICPPPAASHYAGPISARGKVAGREAIAINPTDARSRGISDGDVVRVFNTRGACFAGAVLREAIRPGVVRLSCGAWYDPAGEGDGAACAHGNANVLTRDHGTSRLGQGPSSATALVEVERATAPPPVGAFAPPPLVHPAE
jgi:hemoglobin